VNPLQYLLTTMMPCLLPQTINCDVTWTMKSPVHVLHIPQGSTAASNMYGSHYPIFMLFFFFFFLWMLDTGMDCGLDCGLDWTGLKTALIKAAIDRQQMPPRLQWAVAVVAS